jgi:predicted 3-demethylubiquinone-9 3-methyltransferase (glyoxalase superfamily)
MTDIKQRITPSLWFDRQAEEAANFYASTFDDSRVGNVTLAGKAGFDIHGLPEGTVMNVQFEIAGQRFIAINGGPLFKFNPSISFLVACPTREEVDALWKRLSVLGTSLMELGSYPFSDRYAWAQDKYGLSWQLMFMGDREIKQKITPTLMFVGAQCGKAESAVDFYSALFHHSAIDHFMRYGQGEAPDREGTIRHAGFTLERQEFAAMDSAGEHHFTFNEAISLMVECETQGEIDYYWEKLTDGGQESVCGWLKDRFGVSWQVAPTVLAQMLRHPDPEKVARVTNAFLKMKKFDIHGLESAFKGN